MSPGCDIDIPGNPADVARLCTIIIPYGYISRIEGIRDGPGIQPSDNAADYTVAVIDRTGIVGLFHGTGQAAHHTAYMAGIIVESLIADLSFVIHIIQYGSGIGFFCRIPDDAAHIDSKIIALLKGVLRVVLTVPKL